MSPKASFCAFSGIALIFALTFLSGCAHQPFPSKEIRAGLGKIGISTEIMEGGRLYVPAAGRGTGAAKGAGIVFLKSLEGGAGSRDPIGFALGVAVGVVGAPIGAVVGAVKAMPSEEAENADALIRDKLKPEWIKNLLITQIMNAGRENRMSGLVPRGDSPSEPDQEREIATGLVIRVTRVGLLSSKWGSQPPLSIVLDMDVRLIRVSDGLDLFTKQLQYLGEFHPFVEWFEGGGTLLLQQAEAGCRGLADRIIESFFLREEMWSCTWNDSFCGPRPEYPEPKFNFWKTSLVHEPVGSLQPILRWEPFSAANRKGGSIENGEWQKVTYDLKIWKKGAAPAYERRGLPVPYHELESPLDPNTTYFWSVRVRLLSEGGTRLSDWAYFHRVGYYTFSTPPDSVK